MNNIKSVKILKGTKIKYEYSEDYRSGGVTQKNVTAYYCGCCKKEVEPSAKFCSHCGTPLKGIREI